MTLTSEQASMLGARSGAARRTLTWLDVEAELADLTSLEAVRSAYDRLAKWSAAGLVSGVNASAAVRAVDGVREIIRLSLDLQKISQLEKRQAELEKLDAEKDKQIAALQAEIQRLHRQRHA